jgi:hypothetical protein
VDYFWRIFCSPGRRLLRFCRSLKLFRRFRNLPLHHCQNARSSDKSPQMVLSRSLATNDIRLQENEHLLRPPINNFCLFQGDATVMVVGGPNARTDYHSTAIMYLNLIVVNSTPEFFYQHKGNMLLKVVDNGEHKDIHINEGT